MIRSCKSCKTKCCSYGPNPKTIRSPEDYLENYGTYYAYNTKCSELTDDGKCAIWGTSKLPVECRTHVCSVRVFSEKELRTIMKVDDTTACIKCGCQWMIQEVETREEETHRCEVCGFINTWTRKL